MAYLSVMRPEELLTPTPSGVCCKTGGFHIDPTRPVDKAVITHGHSDHARPGHGAVLATQETLDMMRLRYGEDFAGTTQAATLGETHEARRRDGDASIRPAMCWVPRRSRWSARAAGSSRPATTRTWPIRPARRSSWCPATCSSPRRRSACRCSGIGDPQGEIAKLLHSVAVFPERAHLVGAYSLGKAQRMIALIRQAGYDRPIYLHGAMEKITHYYVSRGIELGELRPVRGTRQGRARRRDRALPALARCRTCGRGGFPIRCRASPPAGCGCGPARGSAASSCRW